MKVQRPGIADSVNRDLDVLDELAGMVEQRTTWGGEYQVCDLADEFSERLQEELDFDIEARNAADIAANLDDDSDVRIPAVFHDLTSRRVLVMEWLDGVSVRETEAIDALGVDRLELAEELLRCMMRRCSSTRSTTPIRIRECDGAARRRLVLIDLVPPAASIRCSRRQSATS